MSNIRNVSPYAGMTVKVKDSIGPDPLTGQILAGQDFTIEDWWQNVSGLSWMDSDGNPAALNYGFRIGLCGHSVPLNNEVLYGKIGMLGCLLHITELVLPEVT